MRQGKCLEIWDIYSGWIYLIMSCMRWILTCFEIPRAYRWVFLCAVFTFCSIINRIFLSLLLTSHIPFSTYDIFGLNILWCCAFIHHSKTSHSFTPKLQPVMCIVLNYFIMSCIKGLATCDWSDMFRPNYHTYCLVINAECWFEVKKFTV